VQLLAHARDALVRNWRIVLLYLVASLVVLTGYSFAFEAMIKAVPVDMTPKPLWYVVSSLSLDLLFVVLIAAFQAVSFALIGEEMDRPLWKCAGWQDGLKRFFTLWFIVNLLYITSARLPMSAPESIHLEVYVLMALFRFGLTVLGVPLGACIVYGGGLRWEDVPGMLAPFFRLFPMAFVALSLGFLQWLIIDVASGLLQADQSSVWLLSVVNVPLIILECLAFAVMWLVCMHHRDIADEFEDDDFDF
jgi:hypothetical protein